jgi:hypothetical protein
LPPERRAGFAAACFAGAFFAIFAGFSGVLLAIAFTRRGNALNRA